MGPKTWRAVFDCYEDALADEISEEDSVEARLADVKALRETLVFVDRSRKSLGFGEHHTIDQIGRDNVRSQANRRVELLFFNEGEEPNLDASPRDSEIYLPGRYQRTSIEPAGAGAADEPDCHVHVKLLSRDGSPLAVLPFKLHVDGAVVAGTTDGEGALRVGPVAPDDYLLELADERMFVNAFSQSEARRTLTFVKEPES
jgi:hypothetical protein